MIAGYVQLYAARAARSRAVLIGASRYRLEPAYIPRSHDGALRTLDLHDQYAKGIRELLERYDGARVAALASLLA